MSQQSATNMSRPTSSSPASAVAATSESAASKKHKIDEIVNESPKETSSDEMTDATAPETPVDFPDHPDAPAPKKLKVSELSPPMNDFREHEEDKANALQVLRKKQRDEKLAKKGKGILEYVKSSKKARLNPHRPRGQEEVQDEEMVDQEEMHVQHVLLQQANDAQEDPVTGGVDTEMHNAQPAGGPTSLEALVASHGKFARNCFKDISNMYRRWHEWSSRWWPRRCSKCGGSLVVQRCRCCCLKWCDNCATRSDCLSM